MLSKSILHSASLTLRLLAFMDRGFTLEKVIWFKHLYCHQCHVTGCSAMFCSNMPQMAAIAPKFANGANTRVLAPQSKTLCSLQGKDNKHFFVHVIFLWYTFLPFWVFELPAQGGSRKSMLLDASGSNFCKQSYRESMETLISYEHRGTMPWRGSEACVVEGKRSATQPQRHQDQGRRPQQKHQHQHPHHQQQQQRQQQHQHQHLTSTSSRTTSTTTTTTTSTSNINIIKNNINNNHNHNINI